MRIPQTGRDEASARNGYSLNPLDRKSEERDETSLVAALAAPSARFYLFADEDVVLNGEHDPDPLFSADDAALLGADLASSILLGFLDEAPRLAARADPQTRALDRLTRRDLRSIAVGAILPPEHLGPLAQAKSLMHWHARHGFCANCGAATKVACAGYRRDCAACGATHFPRTDPVVIMLTTHGGDCLLARQARFAPGQHSALAGFVEPGETIEDAVRREIFEEAGLTIGRVAYHSSQPWPFPSSLMIGCHCEALGRDLRIDGRELESGRWFSLEEARLMLERRHPDGLFVPPPPAIAHQLIKAFLDG